MDPSFMLVMTLIHACIAMTTLAINIYVAHRRTKTSSDKDALRLRAGFAAELGVLKMTYENNIDAIRAEKSVIMSGRAAIAVYRGSLGKLNILHEAEIPAIVEAYAYCETIEGFLAAHGKANGQSSYSMGKDRDYANDLVALYYHGVGLVDAALAAMRGPDRRNANSARAAARAKTPRLAVQAAAAAPFA